MKNQIGYKIWKWAEKIFPYNRSLTGEGVSIMLSKIQNWKDAPLWDVDSIHKATKTWFQFMQK